MSKKKRKKKKKKSPPKPRDDAAIAAIMQPGIKGHPDKKHKKNKEICRTKPSEDEE